MTPKQKKVTERNWKQFQLAGAIANLQVLSNYYRSEVPEAEKMITSALRRVKNAQQIIRMAIVKEHK